MKFDIDKFLRKYIKGAVIPKDVFDACIRAQLAGKKYIDIPFDVLKQIEAKQEENKLRDKEEKQIARYRLKGMELDKQKEYEKAVKEYAKAIAKGEESKFDLFTAFAYAYERIIITLHKLAKYTEEMEYIQAYLNHDISNREKYEERLNKLIKKYGSNG